LRRVYIAKPDGRQRPLGIAALEDKIVQRAVVEVLNAIWEGDFLGFSYGFRPGRGPHGAPRDKPVGRRLTDALAVGITERSVNFILDADIAGFFDTVNHDWLIKFVEHRIADRRIVRLIGKGLKAGVMEEGWCGRGGRARRRVRWSRRCRPTSTCITSSTCGRISGGDALPAGKSSWCAAPVLGPAAGRTRGPTTSSPDLSTTPRPSGLWRRCGNGWPGLA
jgi:reverse transcriptase-like protein